jgi:putative ABC transport system permease protein
VKVPTGLAAVRQDLAYAVRMLIKSPGFTAAAAVTLALGIGANTAIFAVAWRLVLEPLPFPDAHRIVHVWESAGPGSTTPVAPGNYHDWQRDASSFESIAAYTHLRGTVDLSEGGEPEQLRARYVTADYFAVFQMRPLAGRWFQESDVPSGAVMLSESLWRRRFGSDSDLPGRTIVLNDAPHTVVGVMPGAFTGPEAPIDAWIGMTLPPDPAGHQRAHYLAVVARLKTTVSLAQADADVKRVAATAARLHPSTNARLSAAVRSLQSERAPELRTALPMLAGAAALVLLIACVNLAGLQFARGVTRTRELAVRAALGATRTRLLRQLITESLVLSVMGALIGLLTAAWLLAAIARVAPPSVGAALPTSLEVPVVLAALAAAVASAVVFGIAPAWRATSGAGGSLSLRGATSDRSTSRVRLLLVTAQMGVAVVLVIGAALLVTSLAHVLRVDPGFDPGHVTAFDVTLTEARYPTYERRAAFFEEVFARVGAIPGVTAVCAINEVPFESQGRMTYVADGQKRAIGAQPRTITPGCLDTLRLRLVAGRPFTDRESSRVAIVSRRFAQAAWPDQDSVGRRLHVGTPEGPIVEVVGVVDDALQSSLDGPRTAQVYEVMRPDAPFEPARVLLRSDVPLGAIAETLRAAVRAVDPRQPVARLRSLEDLQSASIAGRRFQLMLVSLFAAAALALASTGIYGLLNQLVVERGRELAVRVALGATPASVVRLVMRSAWIAVLAGAATGVAGALAVSTVLRGAVFGVSATEPSLYASATLALALVALSAAWLPARRAAAVDAVAALKRE